MKRLPYILFSLMVAFLLAAVFDGPEAAGKLIGAACLVTVAVWLASPALVARPEFANIAEGQHDGSVTKKADAAHTLRYLVVKIGSDSDHVALCGASDRPLGVCSDQPEAAEDRVAVDLLGATGTTRKAVPSEAMAVGDPVYTAANGKVQNEPATAGTYYRIGYALTAAVSDDVTNGHPIEFEPHPPVKVVVVAALTSTNGTAAAASADLAALAAEAEKIGDDVRALGSALATPAEVKVLAE